MTMMTPIGEMRGDLFGTASLLPGIAQKDDFITPQEEKSLIERMDEADLSPFGILMPSEPSTREASI